MTVTAPYPQTDLSVDPRFASVDCLFFVIGAQKAGTTWLSHYLKAHPDISVPEWKEHDYWNMVEGRPEPSRMLKRQAERRTHESPMRRLGALLPFTLHAKRQRAITLALRAVETPYPPYSAYADVILENVTHKTRAAGEICPEYAVLQSETYARMAALSPNVRFIFLMRDPVARFISGAQHTIRKSFGKAAETTEQVSEALRRFASDPASRHLALSRYDRTIEALESAVPSSRILYLFFEELFDQKKVRRLCDFLGISFVQGDVDRRANSAGARVEIAPEDRKLIAGALSPTYAFMRARYADKLPERWAESEALC